MRFVSDTYEIEIPPPRLDNLKDFPQWLHSVEIWNPPFDGVAEKDVAWDVYQHLGDEVTREIDESRPDWLDDSQPYKALVATVRQLHSPQTLENECHTTQRRDHLQRASGESVDAYIQKHRRWHDELLCYKQYLTDRQRALALLYHAGLTDSALQHVFFQLNFNRPWITQDNEKLKRDDHIQQCIYDSITSAEKEATRTIAPYPFTFSFSDAEEVLRALFTHGLPKCIPTTTKPNRKASAAPTTSAHRQDLSHRQRCTSKEDDEEGWEQIRLQAAWEIPGRLKDMKRFISWHRGVYKWRERTSDRLDERQAALRVYTQLSHTIKQQVHLFGEQWTDDEQPYKTLIAILRTLYKPQRLIDEYHTTQRRDHLQRASGESVDAYIQKHRRWHAELLCYKQYLTDRQRALALLYHAGLPPVQLFQIFTSLRRVVPSAEDREKLQSDERIQQCIYENTTEREQELFPEDRQTPDLITFRQAAEALRFPFSHFRRIPANPLLTLDNNETHERSEDDPNQRTLSTPHLMSLPVEWGIPILENIEDFMWWKPQVWVWRELTNGLDEKQAATLVSQHLSLAVHGEVKVIGSGNREKWINSEQPFRALMSILRCAYKPRTLAGEMAVVCGAGDCQWKSGESVDEYIHKHRMWYEELLWYGSFRTDGERALNLIHKAGLSDKQRGDLFLLLLRMPKTEKDKQRLKRDKDLHEFIVSLMTPEEKDDMNILPTKRELYTFQQSAEALRRLFATPARHSIKLLPRRLSFA